MKHLKKLLAAMLALCMVLCFCACGDNSDNGGTTEDNQTENNQTVNNEQNDDGTTENQAVFTVKVVDEGGNPVSGVMVQLCKEACVPARTDDNGVATFNMEITDGYKLSVMSCPEGYEYTGEAEIYLESGSTEYTLEIKAVA